MKRSDGFTLIELIVVLSLIGIIIAITFPRFQNAVLVDDTKTISRRVITLVRTLKNNAVRDQKRYTLKIDLERNRFWVATDAEAETGETEKDPTIYQVPDGIDILDVEFPHRGKISAGQAEIHFYPRGYSDKALIHMEDAQQAPFSFGIESFLSYTEIYDRYATF